MDIIREAETLKALNRIGAKWASQFENAPVLPLSFRINKEKMICVNDEPICGLSDVDINSIFIDADYFGFQNHFGAEYRFHVDWPYEGQPCVTHVSYYSVRELKKHAI